MNNNGKTLINPNSAGKQTLSGVPGIGPVLAERIIAARPYDSLDDLTRVNGVSAQALENMKPYLTLVGPLDPNLADAQNLMTVPGIGPELAARIIAERPYDSLDELTRVSGISRQTLESIKPYLTLEPLAASLPDEEAVFEEEPQPSEPESVVDTTPDKIDQHAIKEMELEEISAKQEDELSYEESTYSEVLDFEEDYERAQPADVAAEEYFTDFETQDTEEPAKSEEEPIPASEEILEPHKVEVEEFPQKAQTVIVPGVSRTEAVTWAAGFSLLTMLLTLILSLGIIASLNGGSLQFITRPDFEQMVLKVSDLDTRTSNLASDLDGLRLRVGELEALNGRVAALERSLKTAQSDLESARQTLAETTSLVEDLSGQVKTLAEDVNGMQQRLSQVQNFFESLRDLLINLYPVEE